MPDGLKLTAIILSVVKALPAVLLLLSGFFLLSIADNPEDSLDDLGPLNDVDPDEIRTLAIFFIVMVAIGAVLLVFHVYAAARERLFQLLVVSGIMTAIDLIVLVTTAAGGEPIGTFVVLLTFATQATIFVWAWRLRSGRGSASGIPQL